MRIYNESNIHAWLHDRQVRSEKEKEPVTALILQNVQNITVKDRRKRLTAIFNAINYLDGCGIKEILNECPECLEMVVIYDDYKLTHTFSGLTLCFQFMCIEVKPNMYIHDKSSVKRYAEHATLEELEKLYDDLQLFDIEITNFIQHYENILNQLHGTKKRTVLQRFSIFLRKIFTRKKVVTRDNYTTSYRN